MAGDGVKGEVLIQHFCLAARWQRGLFGKGCPAVDRITAIYVRVSTEEQAREGQSIETQIDKLSAYAKFQSWQNVEIFLDDGESAKDMNRPAMKRLLKLIKAGKVAVVATMAVDRLSRNLLDMLQFVELCEQHKTAYVCAGLNFDTGTPIGRMVLQILAAFAEFERAMISSRVKTNMLEISQKKKRYMANPPFGYRLDEHGNLVAILDEAKWVQQAADMFITGHGYRAVAKYLNEAGVETHKKAQWTSSTVRQMLTNELYVGRLIWNRRYYNKDGKLTWRDAADWIVHDNAHPPILTEEQWAAIEKRIKRKVPKGGQMQMKYRLSGLLKCGHCGAAMVSRRYGSKGPHKEQTIFVCSNYQKNGGCTFNRVFVEDAESVVYEAIEQLAAGILQMPSHELEKMALTQADEWSLREASIDARFQRQIQAFENGLIDERDLRIARDRITKERELLSLEKDRALFPALSELQELMKKEASQLLWLWNNGELPVLHNTIRKLISEVVVTDREVSDVRLSSELI